MQVQFGDFANVFHQNPQRFHHFAHRPPELPFREKQSSRQEGVRTAILWKIIGWGMDFPGWQRENRRYPVSKMAGYRLFFHCLFFAVHPEGYWITFLSSISPMGCLSQS